MPEHTPPIMTPNKAPDWWRGAVIYQIYPRSFQDSNGDGIGDLNGITRRLGHVADLGVDAVWISPFFVSPMKDFGYDVADYTDVDPVFGALADFDALVAEAHRLGLKVIIDQVLSHTSDEHPWFKESRASRTNAKADWYVWAEPNADGTPPNNWLSIFGGSAWQWDTRRRQYYLHNYLVEQPDLNFHNMAVQDALLDTVEFWLKRGVDGFRLDTSNFYFHSKTLKSNPPAARATREVAAVNPYDMQEHQYDKSQPENLAFLKRFRSLLDRYGATTSVGEVADGDRGLKTMATYTAGGDKLHMCYTFDFLGPTFTARFFREQVEAFETMVKDGWACWAFSNHDVIRHVSRWGAGRDRDQLARLAIAILLSLRGSVSLYQGEELGLTEAELAFEDLVDPYGITFWPEFKGRDGCRTPMAWDATAPNARVFGGQALAAGAGRAPGDGGQCRGRRRGVGAGTLPAASGLPPRPSGASDRHHPLPRCAGRRARLRALGRGRGDRLPVQSRQAASARERPRGADAARRLRLRHATGCRRAECDARSGRGLLRSDGRANGRLRAP